MANPAGQKVISGTPQNPNEINVADYMGLQASAPQLQPNTLLQDQVVEQTVAPGELQTTFVLPSTAPQAVAASAPVATVAAPVPQSAEQAGTATSGYVQPTDTAMVDAQQVAGTTGTTQAAQGQVTAPMQAATQDPSTTQVSDVEAATQAQAQTVVAPEERQLQQDELVQSVASSNQAAAFTEQVQAAEAQPSEQATVQGQLEGLMQDFEGGQTPAWAAGAMRNATAQMAARGLGASSMAGQAIVQAAMESALPIAQADAQVQAQFESQNLSNRQARAMLAAQQRAQFMGQEFDQEFQARVSNAAKVSDIANMNFTAAQQVALENARMAQTVDLQNLSNKQALVMAEVAQISNLETTNLNNRQTAAVQNAQSFLQMDMSNLSNQQQAVMFDSQSRVQAIFNDQAAINAAKNINAQSENQMSQFFAEMKQQTNQFNTAQVNATQQFNATARNQNMQFYSELGLEADKLSSEALNTTSRFNADQLNNISQFNAGLVNQREQFNVANRMAVDANNVQWRRSVNTANTSATNAALQLDVQNTLGLQNAALNNVWDHFDSMLSYSFQAEESAKNRATTLATASMSSEMQKQIADEASDSSLIEGIFTAGATLLSSDAGGSLLDKWF